MQDGAIDLVLTGQGLEPVLLDVGAAGPVPPVWVPIACHAWYVGFDPDRREMARAEADGRFKRKTIVNEAVTPVDGAAEVRFHLTRSPFCSSTLAPNRATVDNYLGAERFDLEGETTVRAATLNDVVGRLGIDQIHWLKLDTQGTDRRIYDSIAPAMRGRLLAVDLEPGLRGAYVGEDLFGDVHRSLTADGFWLSNLQAKGFVRLRPRTLDRLRARHGDIDESFVKRAVRKTPGWTEVRYLRSVESLEASDAPRQDYAMLWVFATIDGQHGFALDLLHAWERRFGAEAVARTMEEASVACMRGDHECARIAALPGLRKRIKSLARKLIGGPVVRLRRIGHSNPPSPGAPALGMTSPAAPVATGGARSPL